MVEPPIPDDEERRLALLAACKTIYTPQEEGFDDVARLAAEICGTEIALITLVDADYQWFKARVGVEQTGIPRDLSFCGHCVNHRNALVVEDTLLDPRFADNPLVGGDTELQIFANVMSKPPVPFRAHLGHPRGDEPHDDVEALVQKCLRRNRDDRFGNMQELAGALRRCAA